MNDLTHPPVRRSVADIEALFALPFADLMFQAQTVHREHFDPNKVQLSTLLSIKTGGCSEDCGYCPQSVHYDAGVESQGLLNLNDVLIAAKAAKAAGASRFCMGAAWRGPKQHQLEPVLEMVREVKALGLETCATLGMLKDGQAEQLKEAGLDYYNHNLDTAPEFYGDIITTRQYQDRLDTLERVRHADLHVCCGGIVGMGESRTQRAGLIAQLASLDPQPESVPINLLVRRQQMSDAVQALCFLAGANSIFYGEKLLTTGNPEWARDQRLFDSLGLTAL
ncbi:MAG: biotin synthase [Proteobacteria bacterium]|nr:biotin synthase [Pseudomonadota bacterium]